MRKLVYLKILAEGLYGKARIQTHPSLLCPTPGPPIHVCLAEASGLTRQAVVNGSRHLLSVLRTLQLRKSPREWPSQTL